MVSPFYIEKDLSHILSTKRVKKLPLGDLLLESENIKGAEALLKMTALQSITVEATPHRWLNASRGVIGSQDLPDPTEAELLEVLRGQEVTAERRITTKTKMSLSQTLTYGS